MREVGTLSPRGVRARRRNRENNPMHSKIIEEFCSARISLYEARLFDTSGKTGAALRPHRLRLHRLHGDISHLPQRFAIRA
jgi:hypothetical protein